MLAEMVVLEEPEDMEAETTPQRKVEEEMVELAAMVQKHIQIVF